MTQEIKHEEENKKSFLSFINKYGLDCYEALQAWYLHTNQKEKTYSSVEEVWGEAWVACSKHLQLKINGKKYRLVEEE